MQKIDYSVNVKLKNGNGVFFGPGPARLLLAVKQGSSLKQASEQMGMAYSKAWRILRNAESQLGFPLLMKKRGGVGGGGSSLTAEAEKLLNQYLAFQKAVALEADGLFRQYFGDNDDLS